MSTYLLIESRDPFETNEVNKDYEMAMNLAKAGNHVTMFLVQNGVLATRRGSQSPVVSDAISSGVDVLADEFSLKERAISKAALVSGVETAPIDLVVDQLVEGRKVSWL